MNTHVSYPLPLPILTIKSIPGGGQMGRCYSESLYEIVSQFPITEGAFEHLDAAGMLGFGQAYYHEKHEELAVESQPTTVNRLTGEPTGEPPVAYNGEPITNTYTYTYHRYVIRRICDSGD